MIHWPATGLVRKRLWIIYYNFLTIGVKKLFSGVPYQEVTSTVNIDLVGQSDLPGDNRRCSTPVDRYDSVRKHLSACRTGLSRSIGLPKTHRQHILMAAG